MIVDSHQHFWKFDPVRDSWIDDSMQVIRRDFLPDDLREVYDKHKIHGCVAVQADQSETETAFLLNLADKNSFIKGVVGWIDLTSASVNEWLEYFTKKELFKGVRHILQAESDDFMLKDDFQKGISALKNFGLTYDILIHQHQLPNATVLVKNHPEQQFVLDHLAKPLIKDQTIEPWKTQLRELAEQPNVCCKLSGMLTEADWKNWEKEDIYPYMDAVFEAFGTERVLYGSDWPVCLLAGNYAKVLGIVQEYIQQFSAEAQQQILAKNAINFYNLKA